MKKAALVLLLAVALILPVSGQAVDWSKKPVQSERSRSYDALHYLIKIRIDLDGRAFEGATTVTLASLREGLATCVLDAEEFTVTAVVGADGEPLAFDQRAKEIEVRLPRPFRFGEETSFTCFYRGRDPKVGLRFVAETEDNPGSRVLGFVARERPPLVPVLRSSERQGHRRDRRHGQAGSQGGRQRAPGQRDRGPGGRNGDLSLVPGPAALDLSRFPGRRRPLPSSVTPTGPCP